MLSCQKKKKFCADEDKKLTELVYMYGEDWNKILRFMPGRTLRQVMERWKYYLDPTINNEPWTPDEDKRLLQYQREIGNKWTKMLSFFNNRTANQLKNRWLVVSRKEISKTKENAEDIKKNEKKVVPENSNKIEFVPNVLLNFGYSKKELPNVITKSNISSLVPSIKQLLN